MYIVYVYCNCIYMYIVIVYVWLLFLLFDPKHFTRCEPKTDSETPWKQLLISEDNKSRVSISSTEPQADGEWWNMVFSLGQTLSHASSAFLVHFSGTGQLIRHLVSTVLRNSSSSEITSLHACHCSGRRQSLCQYVECSYKARYRIGIQ